MDPTALARFSPPSRGSISDPQSRFAVMKPPTTSIGELFLAEESGLLRFALSIVRRHNVAEELVQDTFLRLQQAWDEVENPRAWAYRSLRNLALNHLRDHPLENELIEETVPADSAAPDEGADHDETVGMVRLLLTEIPAEDRELVLLKYHEDLKYQEISRRTGLSVSNVGYRLHHILKMLGESLRRVGIERSRG